MSRILITLTLLSSILLVRVNNSYGQMSQGNSSSHSVNPVLQWNSATRSAYLCWTQADDR